MFAERQVLERGSQLIGFFHASAQRAAPCKDNNVTRLNGAFLNGRDGMSFAHENAGRAFFAVNTVRINDRGIDGGAFNDRPFRGEISDRKRDSAGEPSSASDFW